MEGVEEWAVEQFGGVELGDKRRTGRAVEIAEAMARRPADGLGKQMAGWNEQRGAYRLLDNEAVSHAALSAGHWQQTRANTYITDLTRGGSSRLADNGRSAVSLNADTDLSETVIFTLQGSRVITYDNNFNRRATQYVLSTVLQVQFFGEPK